MADLVAYTDDFGAFLASANPNLPKDVVADLVKHHVVTLKDVIDVQATGDQAQAWKSVAHRCRPHGQDRRPAGGGHHQAVSPEASPATSSPTRSRGSKGPDARQHPKAAPEAYPGTLRGRPRVLTKQIGLSAACRGAGAVDVGLDVAHDVAVEVDRDRVLLDVEVAHGGEPAHDAARGGPRRGRDRRESGRAAAPGARAAPASGPASASTSVSVVLAGHDPGSPPRGEHGARSRARAGRDSSRPSTRWSSGSRPRGRPREPRAGPTA